MKVKISCAIEIVMDVDSLEDLYECYLDFDLGNLSRDQEQGKITSFKFKDTVRVTRLDKRGYPVEEITDVLK